MRPITLACFLCCLVAPSAFAARCTVVTLKPVPEAGLRPGDRSLSPLTQVRVDKKTGAMTFCAHGAGCYPAEAFEIRSPCRLSKSELTDPDDAYFDAQ